MNIILNSNSLFLKIFNRRDRLGDRLCRDSIENRGKGGGGEGRLFPRTAISNILDNDKAASTYYSLRAPVIGY